MARRSPAVRNDATDPPLLDLKLLRLLDLLYRTGSVTQSAEALGLSQPTASIWLARLRRELGDPLFVRTPSGMRPTPRADAVIVPAREALDALQRLAAPDQAFAPADSHRRLRICMTDASHVTLLPRLLAHVRALAPRVSLEATRIDESTGAALEEGRADLALGLVPWLESGFYQQALFKQDWVCLVNAQHPRIAGRLTLAGYRAEAHVSIGAGTGAPLLADALQRLGIERRVALELPGFLGLPAIVSTTDLVATLPRQIGETLAAMSGAAVVECPVPVAGFVVKQHWHARYHHDTANRWLRGICAELFLAPAASRRGSVAGAPADRARPRRR